MRYTPFILSYIALAAHFLRFGQIALFFLFIIFPLILLIRKPWVPVLAYRVTGFAGLIWVLITASILMERLATDRDWGRMVLILGCVAAFTVFSGLLLMSQKVRARYNVVPDPVATSESTES